MVLQNGQIAEAIYVLDGHFPDAAIVNEMLFEEFESILSRVVPFTDFSGETCYGVYVQFNQELIITACVLFMIDFDEEGLPPKGWNLPFEQLCLSAGKGPDLGAGPIRLTCGSQCSVPWHQAKLWDHEEYPDVFVELQECVSKTKLPVRFEAASSGGAAGKTDADELMTTSSFDQPSYASEPSFSSFEVHEGGSWSGGPQPGGSQLGGSQLGGYGSPAPQQVAQVDMEGALRDKVLENAKQLEQQFNRRLVELEQAHNDRMVQLKQSYEQRFVALTSEHDTSMAEVTGELNQLRTNIQLLISQKKSLEEIVSAQKGQLKTLQEKAEVEKMQSAMREKNDIKAVTEKYEALYSKRLAEKQEKWQISLAEKEKELLVRQDQVKQLRQDVTELRRDRIRLLNSGADKFFEKIEGLGVNFIAFHAGAGHVSIPLSDMSRYIENPTAYAAERCSVDEIQYRHWLSHYENPICRFPLTKDELCGCKIGKVDIPKTFKPGSSDRCEKHQSAFSGIEGGVGVKVS